MNFEAWISVVNFLLALFTFGLVIRFWWQHRRAELSRGWWILIFALGLFAIAETAETGSLLRPELPTMRLGLSVRLFFMAVLLVALYRLFEDVVAAQQRALDEAQKTIQLQAEAVRRAQEIELLARITEKLTETLDLNTVLSELCRRARELIHADSVSVRLPTPTSGGFRFAVDFASALKSRPERLDPAIDDLSWQVVKAGRSAVIEDAKAHPLFGPASPPWLGALAAFPLRRGEEVIGVLTAVFERPRQIEPRDQALMAALADQAAVAVRNAQLHETVELQATTDALTGLANRRRFNEALAVELRRANRYHTPLAVIMADADNLKRINDTYGHTAGDAALQAAARVLRESVRATDLAARFGGDEFAIILPATGREAAEALAARIRSAANDLAIDWKGKVIEIGLCLGVAAYEAGRHDTAEALLRSADDSLYEDKRRKAAAADYAAHGR